MRFISKNGAVAAVGDNETVAIIPPDNSDEEVVDIVDCF